MESESVIAIYPFLGILRASKGNDYRERTRRNAEALLSFLKANGLLASPLSEDLLRSRDLYPSDLTPEGAAFMQHHIYAWLRRTDKAGNEAKVTYLEKELKKWRSKPLSTNSKASKTGE